MSSHQKYEPSMNPAVAALPPQFGRHWVKRLAARMGVPLDTARHWAFRRMPDARRQEIAQALIAECDEIEALLIETRRRWKEVADEMAGPVARSEIHSSGPQAGRVGGEG